MQQLWSREQILESLRRYNDWENGTDGSPIDNATHPVFVSYDALPNTLTVAFPTEEWSKNPNGFVHGGITATMLDMAIGALTYCVTGKYTPTISLQVHYLCPVPVGDRLMVRVRISQNETSVIFVLAEAWMDCCPDKLVATAEGIYHVG